jgi:membrane protein required for colicin V production
MSDLPQFNIVDIIVLVIVLLGAARGLLKGLSGELAAMGSAVISLFAGWYFFRPIGDYLVKNSRLTEDGAYVVSFALVVMGAYILMRILRLLLRSILEFSFKGRIERLGGALAGFLHAAVLVSVVLLFFSLWPHESLRQLVAEESVFGRIAANRLRPFYESLAEKHPVLRFPAEETPVAPEEEKTKTIEPDWDDEDWD